MTEPTLDPGSFRDPTSRVYVGEDAVYRGLRADATAELRPILDSAYFTGLVSAGKVVATDWAVEPPEELGDWSAVLRHERIPFVSYPYEWSFEMLRDAAKLQLDILRRGLDVDVVCKDATSYNVQFVGSRPVFIDVGSFEAYQPGDPWYGYRQFCQLFLYPLLFQAYKDLPFQPWLRGAVDGVTPTEAQAVLGGWKSGVRGLLTHVILHARAEQRFADTDDDIKSEMREAGFNKKLILANVDGLAKLLDRLDWKRSTSTWSDYSERAHYGDRELEQKTDFVRRVVAGTPRSLVWDLGANDGRFSRLAAENADLVLAIDADGLVVDTLYKSLRVDGNEKILPLVMDLSDPSPGIGWRGRERRPFLERSRPDLVLALAVVHHLAIGSNVPVPDFLQLLADLGTESVVEFPTEDDPMVTRLLRNKRGGIHDDYNLASFVERAASLFEIRSEEKLPSGTRVMFHLIPR